MKIEYVEIEYVYKIEYVVHLDFKLLFYVRAGKHFGRVVQTFCISYFLISLVFGFFIKYTVAFFVVG